MFVKDTIVAIATPPGRGGVGIVRVSGPLAWNIAKTITRQEIIARQASYLPFYDLEKTLLDQGIALWFPAPRSFTGEDVLELQAHGGPVVLELIMQVALQCGARLANAGEFSERAFLNDKIDLAQAEAVCDLINASSEKAARCAARSLSGEFSSSIQQLIDLVIKVRVYCEAAIDFPEEEIDHLADPQLSAQLELCLKKNQTILASARQGSLLREGLYLAILGKPNTGKSSLLNCLSQKEQAIVSDIPGTTRDCIRETLHLNGLPVHVTDTAGLRESDDIIEQEGIRRAWLAVEEADHVFLLVDATQDTSLEWKILYAELSKRFSKKAITLIRNKIDLCEESVGLENHDGLIIANISAKKRLGIDALIEHLLQSVAYQENSEHTFVARQRHLEALQKAQSLIFEAKKQLAYRQGELVAEELKQAQKQLGQITGAVSADDLLGEIFSQFCIGK